MYLPEQQQNLRIIQECCICRKEIKHIEKTIECPDCKTIYHHNHLSLWLRIRKKCPICKNLIENQHVQSYPFRKNNSHFNSFRISPFGLYSYQKKKNSFQQIYQAENFYLFECQHCGNVLNTQVGDRLIHCKACGSSISVNTPIKVNNKGHQHSISIKKMDRRSKHGKISSRLVKL
jgi:hypothetical protein